MKARLLTCLAVLVLGLQLGPAQASTTVVRTGPFDSGEEDSSCSGGLAYCFTSADADAGSGTVAGSVDVSSIGGAVGFQRGSIAASVRATIPAPDGPAMLTTMRVRVDAASVRSDAASSAVHDSTAIDPGIASLVVVLRAGPAECACGGTSGIELGTLDVPDTGLVGTTVEKSFITSLSGRAPGSPVAAVMSLHGTVDLGSWPTPGPGGYHISARATLLSVTAKVLDAPGATTIERTAPFDRISTGRTCRYGSIPSRCSVESTADAGTGSASTSTLVESYAGGTGPAEGTAIAEAKIAADLMLPAAVDSVNVRLDYRISDVVKETVEGSSAQVWVDTFGLVVHSGCPCRFFLSSIPLGGDRYSSIATIFDMKGNQIPAGRLDFAVRIATETDIHRTGGIGPARSSAKLTLERISATF